MMTIFKIWKDFFAQTRPDVVSKDQIFHNFNKIH